MGFNLAEHMKDLNENQLKKIEIVRENQKKLGMTPRNDSILTYNFAIGDVPDYLNDPDRVAEELVMVNYIHEKTNYANIIEDVMREIANHIHFKYKLDWNSTWDIVRFYVPDMLKLYCVKKYDLDFSIFVKKQLMT